MLNFRTRHINHRGASAPVACYADGTAGLHDTAILRDGRRLPLEPLIIRGINRAMNLCRRHEQAGYGIDCTVLGALALNGIYVPVDAKQYGSETFRRYGYGRWLNKRDLTTAPPYMRLVQFGRLTRQGLFRPIHTAAQLPLPDTYFQQLGMGDPVALTDAEATLALYNSNAVASLTSIAIMNGRRVVLLMADEREPETFAYEQGEFEWL